MIQLIEWFKSAELISFCLGLIAMAIIIRIVIEIIFDK